MNLTPFDLVRRLVHARLAAPDEIVGCSETEVDRIEGHFGNRLPDAYRLLMRTIGKRCGSFMRDITFRFPDMLDLNDHATGILANWEEGSLLLPESAFVWTMRYGEQFLYFIADGKENDPPVYHYFEDGHTFSRTADSVWQVLARELEEAERHRRDYPDSLLMQ